MHWFHSQFLELRRLPVSLSSFLFSFQLRLDQLIFHQKTNFQEKLIFDNGLFFI